MAYESWVSQLWPCPPWKGQPCDHGLSLGGSRASSEPLPIPSSAASYDKRIILWDLGVPNHDYEFQAR